jgi:glycosyltransferase involved in cell wall biosynthesis
MKLVVFAHTPPPHHGQSYMVQLMLDGLGGDARRRKSSPPHPLGIECYHVNARFSRGLEDIGSFQGAKLFLILWFWLQALWIRFRYGAKNFYYVPAPGKRVALYRDWLVMFLCRPFFQNVILHWHAAGLAKWLETETNIGARAATWRCFRPVNLSIVISRYNVADAEKLLSRRICVVNNGIPDPCPDFDRNLLAHRLQRFAERQRVFAGNHAGAPLPVKLLFLAHCSREKGLFAAIEAVRRANRQLAGSDLPMRLKLTIAGNFVAEEEKTAFEGLCQDAEIGPALEYAGFVSAGQKETIYREADMFIFPTQYFGENQPVNIIEALAYGLPIVTTRWRSLPEMLPPDYPGLVADQNPDALAAAILQVLALRSGQKGRDHFTATFTLERHLAALAAALHTVESTPEIAPENATKI